MNTVGTDCWFCGHAPDRWGVANDLVLNLIANGTLFELEEGSPNAPRKFPPCWSQRTTALHATFIAARLSIGTLSLATRELGQSLTSPSCSTNIGARGFLRPSSSPMAPCLELFKVLVNTANTRYPHRPVGFSSLPRKPKRYSTRPSPLGVHRHAEPCHAEPG